MKIEWLNNKENHLEDGLVDLGAATTDELRKVQVSAEKKRKVRKDCKTMVLKILLELQERLPSRCGVVRNASSLSPVNMVSTSSKHSKRFKLLTDDLYSPKLITAAVADNAKFQYDEILREAEKE